MEQDPTHLDLVSLLDLYNTEVESLNSRLLSGETWADLADQRKLVTKLASLIHKKEPHLDVLKLNVPGGETIVDSRESGVAGEMPVVGSQDSVPGSQNIMESKEGEKNSS